jgi:hypothetical protein
MTLQEDIQRYFVSAPPYQAVCVVGRHRVQQSLNNAMPTDPWGQPLPCLAMAFAFWPRRIAGLRDIPAAAHATSCIHASMHGR